MAKKPVKKPPGHHTDADLKAFVQGVLNGSIFLLQDIRNPRDIPMVFLPVAMGALADIEVTKVGTLYEYMHKAMPRSINGNPCFASCTMMHVDDWMRAAKVIDAERERLSKLEV